MVGTLGGSGASRGTDIRGRGSDGADTEAVVELGVARAAEVTALRPVIEALFEAVEAVEVDGVGMRRPTSV